MNIGVFISLFVFSASAPNSSLPSLTYSLVLPYSDAWGQRSTWVGQYWSTPGKGYSKSGHSLPSWDLVFCRSLGSELRSLWFGMSSTLFNQELSVWHTTSVINPPLLIFILTVICTSKLLSSQRWSHILWALDVGMGPWSNASSLKGAHLFN